MGNLVFYRHSARCYHFYFRYRSQVISFINFIIYCAMGFFDVLLGVALLDSMQKNKRQSNNSSSFWGSNSSHNDYSAYSDRTLDDDCDCGYCSDHDYDESCFGRDDDSLGW